MFESSSEVIVGSVLNAIRSLLPGGGKGGDQIRDDSVDEQKALAYTQDRWNDLKNSYVVWHQSIWQSLLFYVNQSWI